jgi:hypothetical protein
LELSLRTSIADADPFKDDLTCVMMPHSLFYQLHHIMNIADGSIQISSVQKQKSIQERVTLTGADHNLFHIEMK